MAGRVLFLAMGVAAQVIGVPVGSICQQKLVAFTNSTPYADSNLYTNNATQDWNSFTLHLDAGQLWSYSFGGSTGLVAGNPALDQLAEPRSDDVTDMVSRIYLKDLKANATYLTRAFSGREYGITMAFRLLSDPTVSPLLVEYGVYATWIKTRKGDSPIYDAGYVSTLARGASCNWVSYPRSK